MRWRLIETITEMTPGKSAHGIARTNYPAELFQDHFPSFPVTPGTLVVEAGAQLAGRLVEVTGFEKTGHWVFPVLTMIQESKFRALIPPDSELELVTELLQWANNSAVCRVNVYLDKRRVANMRLVLGFDPSGEPRYGERQALEDFERAEFKRMKVPWTIPEKIRGNSNSL